MTEEKPLAMSPFVYTEGMEYHLHDSIRYAGKDVLEKEYRNSLIGERELLILEIFRECGTLTPHLLQEAMNGSAIPASCVKLCASGKSNPYRKELRYLKEIGALMSGSMLREGKEVLKTLHICPVAAGWIRNKQLPSANLYTNQECGKCKPGKGTLGVLNHLAAANFHLRYVTDNHDSLAKFSICSDDNPEILYDARYVFQDGTEKFALSIRDAEHGLIRTEKLVRANLSSEAGFIMIVPSRELMLYIRKRMVSVCSNFDARTEYVTDAIIHYDEELHVYAVHNGLLEIRIRE